MNKTRLLQLVYALNKATKDGKRERMYRCAAALDEFFRVEVPDVFKDYDATWMRFKMVEAMVAFYVAVGEKAQAGSWRNRMIAHYQYVRKSDKYTVPQKHELKVLLGRIKKILPPTSRRERYKNAPLTEKERQGIFVLRAYRWFAEVHKMLPLEGMKYLKPFNIEPFLFSLPVTMPREQVVDEMTRFCYEKGGSLAPRSLQRHYDVDGRPAKHLYVIGNGFDRYHGAESGYMSFRRYLYRQSPLTVGYFDLYFGPRSLDRSFSTPVGWFWCLQPYEYRHVEYRLRYPVATWTHSNLWRDFETNLSELNREKVFDLLDMQLPRVDEGEDGFSYQDYFAPLDDISEAVRNCTMEMKYHFHRWVNTLHYAKGFRKRMLPLDKEAIFLNFNYTLFLESEYGVPSECICYIHGNRKDKFGSLVLGHHSDDRGAFERWKHKNQNRRRYRHVQKDAKGRYFINDKLAYLAFFQRDDKSANWRLPIRFYAVEEAENRLEKYYEENFKNTGSIIDANMGFFDSLGSVEKITIIGCSLGAVDMEYYKQLRASVREDAQWEFSYHTEADAMRIEKFCKELAIDTGCVSTFKM